MKLVDPEGAKMLLKHRVSEFFRVGGFLYLDILREEQKKLQSDASSSVSVSDENENENEMWDSRSLADPGLSSRDSSSPAFGNPLLATNTNRSDEQDDGRSSPSRSSTRSLFTEQSSMFMKSQPRWKLRGI